MKKAKLFQNGQSQAVRLPKEFRFSGGEVYIKQVRGVVMLISVTDPWKPLIESLEMFSEDYMTDRNQPTDQQERDDWE